MAGSMYAREYLLCKVNGCKVYNPYNQQQPNFTLPSLNERLIQRKVPLIQGSRTCILSRFAVDHTSGGKKFKDNCHIVMYMCIYIGFAKNSTMPN